MSYILDALKRAEAERERGQVPGLLSQSRPVPTATPVTPPPSERRPAWLAVTAILLLLACAALWWWLSKPGAQQSAPPSQVLTPPAANPPAPIPAASVALRSAPAPEPPTTPPPILAPEPVAARQTAEPAPRKLPKAAAETKDPAPRPDANGKTATAETAAATDTVRSFGELLPETRAQLPQVNVSGSTYSSNPAHRMLIANGKVLQEGDEIAPGLKLETIGPSKAVLNHRGTRYSIGY